MDGELHPLVALMRRYSYAYTANHDFAVADEIMVPDYQLVMGDSRLVGRDDSYKPGTQRVFDEFPGLGFVVHDVVCNGDRIALRFSEHGRSVTRGGSAVWAGISLYRWNGSRLLQCIVEQDYWARREQLHGHGARPIEPPGLDPWTQPVRPADQAVERSARAWLGSAGWLSSADAVFDDEWCAPAARVALEQPRVQVDDLFSAGDRVAFHVTVDGRYAGGLPGLGGAAGTPVRLAVSGLLEAPGGEVGSVRAVSSRLAVFRQLGSAEPRAAGHERPA